MVTSRLEHHVFDLRLVPPQLVTGVQRPAPPPAPDPPAAAPPTARPANEDAWSPASQTTTSASRPPEARWPDPAAVLAPRAKGAMSVCPFSTRSGVGSAQLPFE